MTMMGKPTWAGSRTMHLSIALPLVALLFLKPAPAQNTNAETGTYLAEYRKTLRAEVDAGNLTIPEAKARVGAMKMALYVKGSEKTRRDAELAAAEAEVLAAIARGDIKPDEAETETAERKGAVSSRSRARVDAHGEFYRTWEECREDVAADRMTLSEAETRTKALKKSVYRDGELPAGSDTRAREARTKLKAHLLTGDMTADEVMSRMLAFEMALLVKGCERAWFEARLKEASQKLETRVASGDMSSERAKVEMAAVRREAAEKLQAADEKLNLAKLLEPESAGNQNRTAAKETIWSAAAQGNLVAVKQFATAGADIDATLPAKARGGGNTPLHIAVMANRMETAKLLIELGANVNVRGDNVHRNTPLHIAAFSGRVQCARELVKAGADVNAGDKNGYTPLDAAMYFPKGATQNKAAKGAVAELLRQHGGMRRDEMEK